MAKLLYIEASPRGKDSISSQISETFLNAYKAENPGDEIDHIHLFGNSLPTFGEEAARQKMEQIMSLVTTGKGIAAEGEWEGVTREIERFKSADKVLISSPMWNFSVPYPLKQYIDIICQPGHTFYVNRKGDYVGMVKNKPLQLILASGSEYSPDFPRPEHGTKTNYLRSYLEHIARFIGFEDIRCLHVQPTGVAPRELEATLKEKHAQARQAADIF